MWLKQSFDIDLIYFQKFMKNCKAEKQFMNELFKLSFLPLTYEIINYQKTVKWCLGGYEMIRGSCV